MNKQMLPFINMRISNNAKVETAIDACLLAMNVLRPLIIIINSRSHL